MVNPAGDGDQGYDDRMQSITFDGLLDISDNLPILVAAGSSVCSSVSVASFTGNDSSLDQIEILTVLASAPAPGSFRPPYVGTTKTLVANISDIDYSQLASLAQPNSGTNVPSLSTVESYFSSPWYEHVFNWTGRFLHPDTNFPLGNYGREVSKASGDAVLSLQLDYSNAQKQTLLYGVVQAGIDLYGAAKNDGAVWLNDGGHNQGRKMLVLLTAKVLGHADMLTYADAAAHDIFQEDHQTFVVTEEAVNITNDFVGANLTAATFTTSTKNLNQTGKFSGYSFTSGDKIYITGGTGITTGLYEVASRTDDDNIVLVEDIGGTNPSDVTSHSTGWHWAVDATHETYEASDIGVPSWGIRHQDTPQKDTAYYPANYETINNGPGMAHAAAAIVMGVKIDWNYPPFFSYYERVFPLEKDNAGGGTNTMSLFAHDMYTAYVEISSSPPVQMSAMSTGTALISGFSAFPATDGGAEVCGAGTKPCGGRCIDAAKSCTNKVTLDPDRWSGGVIPANTYFGDHGSSDGDSTITASTEITLTYSSPTTRVDATDFTYPTDLSHFDIRIDEGVIVKSDALTRKIVAPTGISMDLEVRAVGKNGVAGAWSTIQTVTP